jgi:NhaA family Na+:H+ antiporter
MTLLPDMRARIKGAAAFFQHDASGGIVLLLAVLAAMVIDNSPAAKFYDGFFDTRVGVRIGELGLEKPLLLWINDGLMAVFFFLIGLEIKRELVQDTPASLSKAALPGLAALGGMVVPAVIYVICNGSSPGALRGWAIPCATDIAFAVGVLALLADCVPVSLKVFLLALAILDDLGAIVIIAAFYTADLHWSALLLAAVGCGILLVLNALNVLRVAPYVLTGFLIWVCVLKSGVHATLAGVVVALAIPLAAASEGAPSLLEQLEDRVHRWVAFGVLPLFAFANAGVSFDGLSPRRFLESVPLGIAIGLFVGKPLGIFSTTWLAVRTGLVPKPEAADWSQVLGIGLLGGIGFTMSLFIGMLAFGDAVHASQLRLGVLVGSVLSALVGYAVLRASAARPRGLPE